MTPKLFLWITKYPQLEQKWRWKNNTYQSVEAHLSTAFRPVLIFWQISPSISEDCITLKTWLITEDSLRIRPMMIHQSRHPASMKICSKYLYGKKLFLVLFPPTRDKIPKRKQYRNTVGCFFLSIMLGISHSKFQMQNTYRSWTCDLCGPLLASSREICSSSDWVRLRLEKFSSTMVQSPSTIELVSVRSVAEPMLHSSPIKNTQKHKGKKTTHFTKTQNFLTTSYRNW